MEVFREWANEHILKLGSYDTIVLHPIENISPRYRDEPLKSVNSEHEEHEASLTAGRDFYLTPGLALAPMLKAPELVMPSESYILARKTNLTMHCQSATYPSTPK